MRAVLENAPTPQDAVDDIDEPAPLADIPQDSVTESEPEPADATEPVPQTRTAAARRQVNDWASSLERGLLTPELPRGHVESRSRPTMQCQRLLKDTYVHLSVPAKAQPRQGTDDPKGHFVIAFTDDGIEHFTANRSNKASPGEHLGKLETAHPAVFEPADKRARHGGTLTIGTRQFTIPLLYVNSLTEYLEDAAE